MTAKCTSILYRCPAIYLCIPSYASIPLQQETIRIGPSSWFRPPTRPFCIGNTNSHADPMQSLANPTRTSTDPTQTPPRTQREPMEYSSRWARQGWIRVDHVDFMLFVSIPTANPVSGGIWALECSLLEKS